jgi:hypothetical protein
MVKKSHGKIYIARFWKKKIIDFLFIKFADKPTTLLLLLLLYLKL